MDTLNDVFTNRRRHNNLLVCRLNWNIDTVSTEPSETQRPSLTCHLSHTHTHTHRLRSVCDSPHIKQVTMMDASEHEAELFQITSQTCRQSSVFMFNHKLLQTSSPHVSGCFLRLRPGVSCDCVLRFEHGLNKVLGQSSLGQKHHSLVFRDPSRFLPV